VYKSERPARTSWQTRNKGKIRFDNNRPFHVACGGMMDMEITAKGAVMECGKCHRRIERGRHWLHEQGFKIKWKPAVEPTPLRQ